MVCNVSDIVLVKTCSICPEQYEAYDLKGNHIAYLRLRWGNFTVECPGVEGQLVYNAKTLGDGVFDDSEREEQLLNAKEAIVKYYNQYYT